LPLEVPVLLTSLDVTVPFSEQCNTTLVNAHGCGLVAPSAIAQGVHMRMEIVSAKRHTTARVEQVVSLGGDPETWLLGLELDVPGNFWGIDYAPSDWRIEESASSGAAPFPQQDPDPAATTARARRWRLADISVGACYLETAAPFPVGSPVLMSVRASQTECLLEGTVCVSHPEIGMGVEFTGTSAADRQARVEQLITRLKSDREAPKIFVGRKEREQEITRDHARDESNTADPNASDASENPSASVSRDDELHDPLLQLIREGRSLTPEQFLNDLRAQRLGKRRDPRINLALPVRLTGTDIGGRPLDQRVVTVNISRRGALLDGVHGRVGMGDLMSLSRLHRKEQFRVAWVGLDNTPAAGQIGVAAVDPNTSFWTEVLETIVQSRIQSPAGWEFRLTLDSD
jgi:hypothetical protein